MVKTTAFLLPIIRVPHFNNRSAMRSFILASCLAFASFATAQTPSALTLAEKVVDASGLRVNLENSFVQSMEAATLQLKATGGEELANAAMAAIRKFFTDNVKWEEIRPTYAKAYAAEFSEAELAELLSFYESPTGKKLAAKSTGLSADASKAMKEKMSSQMPALQAEVMKIVREHLEQKQKAAK